MRTPSGLTPTARAAFRHAVRVLDALGQDPELSRDAIIRYSRASADAAVLRSAWKALGYPALTRGGHSGRVPKPHPLPEQIRMAERLAAELGDQLGLSPSGRRRLRTGSRGMHKSADRQAGEVVRLVTPTSSS